MLQYIDHIAVFGDVVDEGALKQIRNCAEDAFCAALMADHHKGYAMPIGGVVGYLNKISPAGVGYDIACGNKAIKLDVKYDDIKDDLESIADSICTKISFGIGRANNSPIDSYIFDDSYWPNIPFLKQNDLKDMARAQLGTVGSGNHFVDVFTDEDGYIWVGCHFGSRGLGHKIATEYIKRAGGNPNEIDGKPCLIDVASELGAEYLAAMLLAGTYAQEGRNYVCKTVANIIGATITDYVHNHHNYAWLENHFGGKLWVVRKGATPAYPNERLFVGGSMGDDSYILVGKASQEAKESLYSAMHGAGRVLSRTQAAGKKRWVHGKVTHMGGGCVDWDAVKARLSNQNIILRGGGADEAPEVYKRLSDVVRSHSECVDIVHTLTPLIVCMAGLNEFDPYKD